MQPAVTVQRCYPVLQINPVTAYGLLKVAAVPQGEHLLQTAATGAVGKMVISLAKHYGIKIINSVRRDDAVQELKAMGCVYSLHNG